VAIAKRADFETTAGFGLHPALSNMSADGNLPSGSEQLYAFKLYLATSVDIPESIICKDINQAIAVNFPGKNLKMGFYHDTVLTEESTSPSERIKNN
jgi:protein-tyrosine phosphatase